MLRACTTSRRRLALSAHGCGGTAEDKALVRTINTARFLTDYTGKSTRPTFTQRVREARPGDSAVNCGVFTLSAFLLTPFSQRIIPDHRANRLQRFYIHAT